MPGKICYLGDDHLQGAAAYLAGIMLHHGLAFDYVPSDGIAAGGFRFRRRTRSTWSATTRPRDSATRPWRTWPPAWSRAPAW